MNQLLKEYSKKTVVPTGRVNGAIYKFSNNPQSEESDDSDMEDEDQSYEQDFVQNEMKKYSLVSDKKPIVTYDFSAHFSLRFDKSFLGRNEQYRPY